MSIAAAEVIAGGAEAAGAEEAAGGGRIQNFFNGVQDHLASENMQVVHPQPAAVGNVQSAASSTVNPNTIL